MKKKPGNDFSSFPGEEMFSEIFVDFHVCRGKSKYNEAIEKIITVTVKC